MIRSITAAEIPLCVGLIRRSFLTVAHEFGLTRENAPRFTAFAVSEERLAWQLAQGRPMLARFDGAEAVGYYSLEPFGDGTCELNNLCVAPERRHEGIGAALLRDAEERAMALGCGLIKLGIVEENERLRSWYELHGFAHVGTKKFDFFPFTCGYMEKSLCPGTPGPNRGNTE